MIFTVVLLFGSPRIRKRLVSAPLLRQFRRELPLMSETEEVAINAGTVWWDAELFKGRPRYERLMSLPSPPLTERELQFLDGPVERLCDMLDDWKITHEEKGLAPEIWDYLQKRFFWPDHSAALQRPCIFRPRPYRLSSNTTLPSAIGR